MHGNDLLDQIHVSSSLGSLGEKEDICANNSINLREENCPLHTFMVKLVSTTSLAEGMVATNPIRRLPPQKH